MNTRIQPVGTLLRGWRQRRRLSQLHLAAEAEISQRHLSFVESGRAAPSREMLLHLCEQLAIPLRDRNALLAAGGFASLYRESDLKDPGSDEARRVLQMILEAHTPYPALAIDRHWTLVLANKAVGLLLTGIDPALLTPPVNVLRLSLHPAGLAPRIVNFGQWRAHVLTRLTHQADQSGDPVLVELASELKRYPSPTGSPSSQRHALNEYAGLAVPLELMTEVGVLSFLSTTTVFGTPVDISLEELAIETFFPANPATAQKLGQLGKQQE